MIGRLMDDRRRRWRRCMVEAGTNMSVSVVTTVVRHGKEQRREENKKLKFGSVELISVMVIVIIKSWVILG